MASQALGTPRLVGGVTLTPALLQWLADCQIYELQPIPLRSAVLPRRHPVPASPGAAHSGAARDPHRRELAGDMEKVGTERKELSDVAEAPWSVAEWAVALRFDHPRATVLVLLLG